MYFIACTCIIYVLIHSVDHVNTNLTGRERRERERVLNLGFIQQVGDVLLRGEKSSQTIECIFTNQGPWSHIYIKNNNIVMIITNNE